MDRTKAPPPPFIKKWVEGEWVRSRSRLDHMSVVFEMSDSTDHIFIALDLAIIL